MIDAEIEPVEFIQKSHLTELDWFIILLFLIISLAIGLYYSNRGRKSILDYFASGQGVPWWILGTSMVATTFSADTPLAISGLVVKQGIWGNWFWWSQITIFMSGVFFFSRLWRRAHILTDIELVDLRYSGQSSKILRGFRAIYFALPYNGLIMGWVILSMTKILGLTFNLPRYAAVAICILITALYSAMSGLWGVLITDFFQFILAMGMAVVLAFVALNAVGGMENVLTRLPQIYGEAQASSMTSMIPSIAAPNHAFTVFLLYILLLWWVVGSTDGGLFFAQRMISAKNEKHSFLGYLWFNVAHFCLRPWPWIVVGLVAAIQFPGIAQKHPVTGELKVDPELGYIAVMLTYMKPGLLGLMLASFLAAFMSTISSQMNWGASYLINDLYRPFIKKNASEKHYVRMSTCFVIIMAMLGGIVSFFLDDIFVAWLLLSAMNAGIGVVYIVRWYWWRVNAWSEISAIASILVVVTLISVIRSEWFLKMILISLVALACIAFWFLGWRKENWRRQNFSASVIIIFMSIISLCLLLTLQLPEKTFPWTLLYTVPISTVVWLTTTLLTEPVAESRLMEFYRRVQPGGPGWKRISDKMKNEQNLSPIFTKTNFLRAFLGIVAVYSVLLGLGNIILGRTSWGIMLAVLFLISTLILIHTLSDEKWQ